MLMLRSLMFAGTIATISGMNNWQQQQKQLRVRSHSRGQSRGVGAAAGLPSTSYSYRNQPDTHRPPHPINSLGYQAVAGHNKPFGNWRSGEPIGPALTLNESRFIKHDTAGVKAAKQEVHQFYVKEYNQLLTNAKANQAKIANLNSNIDRLQAAAKQHQNNQATITNLTAENERLARELAAVVAESESITNQMILLQQTLDREASTHQATTAANSAKQSQLQTAFDALKETCDALRQQKQGLDIAYAKLQRENNALSTKIKQLEGRLRNQRELESKLATAQNELNKLREAERKRLADGRNVTVTRLEWMRLLNNQASSKNTFLENTYPYFRKGADLSGIGFVGCIIGIVGVIALYKIFGKSMTGDAYKGYP